MTRREIVGRFDSMAEAPVYKAYSDLNERLACGQELFMSASAAGCRFDDRPRAGSRRLRLPAIGVFTGCGASHSWLWFVDLFDRMGFHDVAFVDESDIRAGALAALDVLAVSGGDTFAVARGLGPPGARRLREFIESGGLYIGSCAGAYLPMNSSKPHLSDFNFAPVKITNLSKLLPDCRRNERKFCTAYGCDFVFHPVREAVCLRDGEAAPFADRRSFEAPLYGGPGMQPAAPAQTLSAYEGFTARTQYLVSEALAQQTLLGSAAAVRVPLGMGRLYLFGPHFEHPGYPEANRRVADAIYWDGGRTCNRAPGGGRRPTPMPAHAARRLVLDVKRELSNARIVAAGIELSPVVWRIGAKYYEPEKIRVFLESMWRRVQRLEELSRRQLAGGGIEALIECALETTGLLRRMKPMMDCRQDTLPLAERLFECLGRYAAAFFRIYFETLSIPPPNSRSQHWTPLPIAAESELTVA